MPIHQLSPQQAKQMTDNGEAVIVDLRGEDQYKVQHIKGARHIPSEQIELHKLPDMQGKKMIVHCNKGGRAGRFCNALMQHDAEIDIYHLEGGIQAWVEAGLATE